MRTIQGFYRIPSLANNNIGVVSTFGEIDRQDMTYTTDERNFSYPSLYPNVELVTMQIVDELSQSVLVTEAVTKKIVAIGEWLVEQHTSGQIPANAAKANFYAALQVEFGDVNWLSIGDLTRSAENAFLMPTYVEFNYTDDTIEYYVKIWLAASNFADEYEPYKLYIIPPVDDLAQLINNTSTVAGIIANNTPARVLEKYNAIRGKNPETRFDSITQVHHDPNDAESMLTTEWYYLAYGVAGTNVDNIKTALRDYLASNSDYQYWNKIFPSLYEENDFTVLPLWDNIAVPATQVDQNLYASYKTLKGLSDISYNLVPTSYGTKAMVQTHIANNLELFSTYYRGMLLAVIANPSNLNSMIRLSLLYPDYANTPATDPDFERMQETTRTFAETLSIGLEKARTLTDADTVPSGYYRTRRNNLTYLTFLYLDYQYMILTRESYLAKLAQLGAINA